MSKMISFIMAAAVAVGGAYGQMQTNSAQRIVKVPKNGGMLRKEYKKTRNVFFVNAQSRASKDLVLAACRDFEKALRTPVKYADGKFDFSAPKVEGELSVYVIDDEKLPMSLVALEGRWAFVNVAPLTAGQGEKKAYFEARVRKECARVACMLFGGLGSAYPGNLMSNITSPEDLDKCEVDALSADGLMRCSRNLLNLGVKPFRFVPYKQACEEGWAPAPTNDVQKAIWDKVHAMPTAPLKIKPETKKVAQ